ncbi:hypothetical protein CC2G_002582 [Coprinopsis cinerea AmutBmut pab1-1]|nr:hypothetical protein CC2G_002582 [Coprinopsis cinerea AmutBmut pab1-1]
MSFSSDRYLPLRLGPSTSQRLRLNSQTTTPLSSDRLTTDTFAPANQGYHLRLRTPVTPTRRGDISPSQVRLTLGSRQFIQVHIDSGDSSSVESACGDVSEEESDIEDDSSLASFQRRLFEGASELDDRDVALGSPLAPGPCGCQCGGHGSVGAVSSSPRVATSNSVGIDSDGRQASPGDYTGILVLRFPSLNGLHTAGPQSASFLQNTTISVNSDGPTSNSHSMVSENPPQLCTPPSPAPRGSASNPIWVMSSPPTLHHTGIPRPNAFPLRTVSSRNSSMVRRSPYHLRARRPVNYHQLSTVGNRDGPQHQPPVPEEPLVPGPWNDSLWTPPSPPRPAISRLSGISRRVRISRFDPERPPRNNMSTLYALGSVLGPGITLRQFGRLFSRCLRCENYSFVDHLDDHKCPEDTENHVNIWQGQVDDLDLTNFLFAEECPGLTAADLQAIFATCNGCDLVMLSRWSHYHRCPRPGL